MGSALYEVFCPFMEVIFSLLFLGINPKKGACVQSQEVWEESLSGEELSLVPCSHLKSARQRSKTFVTTSKALLFFFNAQESFLKEREIMFRVFPSFLCFFP